MPLGFSSGCALRARPMRQERGECCGCRPVFLNEGHSEFAACAPPGAPRRWRGRPLVRSRGGTPELRALLHRHCLSRGPRPRARIFGLVPEAALALGGMSSACRSRPRCLPAAFSATLAVIQRLVLAGHLPRRTAGEGLEIGRVNADRVHDAMVFHPLGDHGVDGRRAYAEACGGLLNGQEPDHGRTTQRDSGDVWSAQCHRIGTRVLAITRDFRRMRRRDIACQPVRRGPRH